MTQILSRFNGVRTDMQTGRQHLGNGYRAYSPVLNRFIASDDWSPFGSGGLNSYAYCSGDPVNLADPGGHMGWQAVLGLSLGLFGLLGSLFTAGTSLAATGCISMGLVAATSVSLIADITGIASAATTDRHPAASGILGWVSFATGMLSLSAGLMPTLASITAKVDQKVGKWVQGSFSFLGNIERRGNRTGIALSGEFLNALFLGRTHVNGQMQWSFRFEDRIPLGRRLNIVMGSLFNGAGTQARTDIMLNNQWVNHILTPARLRDYTLSRNENYDLIRLVIPNSAEYTGRSRMTMAGRYHVAIDRRTTVAGFIGDPVWGGVLAEPLRRLFRLTGQLDAAGYSLLWANAAAQDVLNRLSLDFGNLPGALTFDGNVQAYPVYRRNDINDIANLY